MLRIDLHVQQMLRLGVSSRRLVASDLGEAGQAASEAPPGNDAPIEAEELARLIEECASPEAMTRLAAGEPADFEHASSMGVLVRVAAVPEGDGWRVQLRLDGEEATPDTAPADGADIESEARPLAAPSARPAAPPPTPRTGPERSAGPALEAWLARMRALEASDLHLAVGAPPHVRVEGALVPLEGASVLTAADVESQIRPLLTAAHAEELARFGDTELAHGLPDGARFRVRCYLDRTGLGAVLRFVPGAPPSPETLGLPRRVVDLCQLTRGLVLVTGPRGSGASTTLASLVDVCNASRAGRIATIEERFEFVLESRRSLVTQREIGVHAPSFERALRAALREDTDVLMVGELRGAEATMLAVEAADTGRLVFASVPAGGAVEAIERLLSAFPLERQAAVRERLAGTLRAVLSQRLCRLKSTGRVAVFEVLLGTPSVANLLREGQLLPLRSLMHAGRSLGMQVLNDALIELVRAGSVEPAEAYLASNEKGAFRDLLAKLGHRLDPALVARDP